MSDNPTPSQDNEPSARGGSAFRFEPFVVEFGDDHNRRIRVGGGINQEFRGAYKRENLYSRENGGRPVGEKMQGMPDIPGQRLAMRPARGKGACEIRIFDPLEEMPELLDRINNVLEKALIANAAERKHVDAADRTLDVNQSKSLLMELRRLSDGGKLTVVKGSLPTEAQIEKMPGRELYDSWNSNSRRPRFIDEVEEWEQRLERA